jgi:hypothetical protein
MTSVFELVAGFRTDGRCMKTRSIPPDAVFLEDALRRHG